MVRALKKAYDEGVKSGQKQEDLTSDVL